MFRKNIGKKDRWIRFTIGVVLLVLAYVFWSWILLAAAAFTFFESLMSWCIMYQLLGKSSCPIRKDKK